MSVSNRPFPRENGWAENVHRGCVHEICTTEIMYESHLFPTKGSKDRNILRTTWEIVRMNKKIAVAGTGYVGLSISCTFGTA